ncbi:MAG: DEAD/DEAH box helicase [Thermoanaerobacterium thermosaccharolyticum]|jgi:type III restriction enzyme
MAHRIVFNFDDKLPYQRKAIDSVVRLFEGQDRELGDVIYRGAVKHIKKLFEGDPVRNRLDLGPSKILENLRNIQHENMLFPSSTLDSGYNFTIEMETGTGKTYVYLRTILELYEAYNFMKFIIVVPTIAIRKGIEKSIEMLRDHFKTLYNGLDISKYAFVYDSSNMGKLDDFVEARDLRIAIMNIQAFNKDTNKIRKEDERGKILWEMLKYVNPIVIIDEPQRLEGSGRRKSASLQAIEELNPLFILRYSATHKKLYNQVYKLDSYEAYNQDLVKKIEVKTVYGSISKEYNYVRYVEFTKDLKAKIEIFYSEPGESIRLKTFNVLKGASLYELSGGLPQYRNMIVLEDPHKINGLKIGSGDNVLVLKEGENNYDIDELDLIRIQIRLTIQAHFQKQLKILEKGYKIKVLSLFFIDAVKNFRDSESPDGRGIYAKIFDEEYERIIHDPRYNEVFKKYPELFPEYKNVQKVREGYFARDKKNNEIEIEDFDWSKDELQMKAKSQEDIERGIQLILEKKDELISFEEPLAFIFSHSALREGWDNPNVFQLCTLKKGSSEIAKKQEIGRGLRLPVDIHGNRRFDSDINVLTVVANDYYDHFAEMLQKDFNDEAGFDKEEVTYDVIYMTLEEAGIPKDMLVAETIEAFKTELVKAGIIDTKNNKLTKDAAEILYYDFENPVLKTYEKSIKEKFAEKMQEKGSKRIEIKNGDEEPVPNGYHSFVTEREFQKLWNELRERIVKRTVYKVKIDSEQFISECISEINDNLKFKTLRREFMVAEGRAEYGNSRMFKLADAAETSISLKDEGIEVTKTDFEIVNYLMHHTMLPRKAIFKIINGLENKRLLQKQAVLDEVMKLILDKLTEYEVKNIDYEVIDGYVFQENTIFAVEEIERYMFDNKRAYKTNEDYKKTLYKYIKVDSDGEYEFARSLDADPDVLLFTKLKKGGLTIDTPYGNYSPDWAVIYRIDVSSAKLYFIVETKCDKEKKDLTRIEDAKIKCAKKHFAKVADDVTFDWVDGYRRFKEIVNRESARRTGT